MLSVVLQRLEVLQSELASIDPVHETDAADRVAAMAVALRDTLAQVETSRSSEPADEALRRRV